MDSEHRHELKTNELQEWLKNFNLSEFLKKHGSTIIGVVLIIAAIFSYFYFKSTKTQTINKHHAQMTSDIQLIGREKLTTLSAAMQGETDVIPNFMTLATKLKESSDKTEQPQAAAMALIKRAEALRAELHYTQGKVEDDVIISQIELARKAYKEALEKAEGNKIIEAMAKYGLALSAEEVGDFIKAKEIYRQIADNSEYEGTSFQKRAQLRLEVIADHQKVFTFAEGEQIPAPRGFDKSATEALKRGDIYIEKPEEEKASEDQPQPETGTKSEDTEPAPSENTSEPENNETQEKSTEANPDTEAGTD